MQYAIGGRQRVEYSTHIKLEVVWTVSTAVLFVGLNLMGSNVWARERFAPQKPGSGTSGSDGHAVCWYSAIPV